MKYEWINPQTKLTCKNLRSFVKHPNTPESDAKRFVPHIVEFDLYRYDKNPRKCAWECMAMCPLDAIDRFRSVGMFYKARIRIR